MKCLCLLTLCALFMVATCYTDGRLDVNDEVSNQVRQVLVWYENPQSTFAIMFLRYTFLFENVEIFL